MKNISNLFKEFQHFSLDVAFGALMSAAFFHQLYMHVHLPYIHGAVLFFAVVGIYTFDHLLDLSRIDDENLSERRLEHKSRSVYLKITCVLSLILAGIGAFYLDLIVVETGMGIAFGLTIYYALILRSDQSYFKDIGVTIGYCAGISLPIISYTSGEITVGMALVQLSFFVATFFIMIFYSVIDAEIDKKEHIEGLSTKLTFSKSRHLPFFFIGFQVIILSLAYLKDIPLVFILISASQTVVLFSISKIPNLNSTLVRYLCEWSYLLYGLIIFLI